MKIEFLDNHKYIGEEYDWAALDKDGNIGYFSTAGCGPIPHICENEAYFENLFEDIKALKKTCEATPEETRANANLSDWLLISERGLYAYDRSQKNKRYELIDSPKARPKLTEIPNHKQIKQIILNTSFKTSKHIYIF